MHTIILGKYKAMYNSVGEDFDPDLYEEEASNGQVTFKADGQEFKGIPVGTNV